MASPKLYTRLPGRGIRRAIFAVAATRCRLWLGPDHLLAVDATTASEEYRRFYYRDIEAFVIRRTGGRAMVNWVLLAVALISIGPLLYMWRAQGSAGWAIAAICLGSLWLLLALINTLRGAMCETKVRTAVQFEHLPSLGRLPAARKVLARLAPFISEAQGAATPEELAAAVWITGEDGPRPALRHERGHIHYAMFGTLLADGVLTFVAYGFFRAALQSFVPVSTLLTLTSFLLCIAALVRQSGTDLPTAPRAVTFSALGFNILGFATSFIFGILYAARHPGEQVRTGLEFVDEPGFQTVVLIAGVISAVIGLAGLAAMRAPRRPQPAA